MQYDYFSKPIKTKKAFLTENLIFIFFFYFYKPIILFTVSTNNGLKKLKLIFKPFYLFNLLKLLVE